MSTRYCGMEGTPTFIVLSIHVSSMLHQCLHHLKVVINTALCGEGGMLYWPCMGREVCAVCVYTGLAWGGRCVLCVLYWPCMGREVCTVCVYTGLAWGGRYVLCVFILALHGEGGMYCVCYTGLAWGGRYVLCVFILEVCALCVILACIVRLHTFGQSIPN